MDEKYIRARKSRNNMTEQEKKLWYYLRKRFINNCRFRRQYPIGNYVVDFVCREKNLIIELDDRSGFNPTKTKNIKDVGLKPDLFCKICAKTVLFCARLMQKCARKVPFRPVWIYRLPTILSP